MGKRINIVLPDETLSILDRVASAGTRSAFISRAVLHYIETQSSQSLRQTLAAGYVANAERDLAIAAEWFPLEGEASVILDDSNPVRTKRAVKKRRR
jgi:CopG family transcriptional regulator/antitoxin EndoAI